MTFQPILALAPNGAYKQKTDHPALPLSQDEIVQCAVDASHAGATLFHLHIRDEVNQHSLDPDTYLRTIHAIEDVLGNTLVIQITSESANIFTPQQQIESIKAVKPECVSIALREIIPDSKSVHKAQALFDWCAEHGCRIQYILYSEAELLAYFSYIEQDIIPAAPHSVLFVLGQQHKNQATSAEDLIPFITHQQNFIAPWMVCAFGASEQTRLIEAAFKGGHIRQGFENNLLNVKGKTARNNAAQLRSTAIALNTKKLALASSAQTRQILQTRST